MTYTHVRDLLRLFRNGYDSLEISYIAGLPEPTVYNQLHEQREADGSRLPSQGAALTKTGTPVSHIIQS